VDKEIYMAWIKNGVTCKELLQELKNKQVSYKLDGRDIRVRKNDIADFYGKKYGLDTIGSRGGTTFWSNIVKRKI
jgi:hypothetical protein